MNTAKVVARGGTPSLTEKQARFVCALLERKSKAAAYRSAYGHNISSRDACIRGCRVAKSAAVRAALAEAENGDFSGLIICGVEAEILALKRISNDPTVAAYVRLEALRALMEHRRAIPEPEPEPPKKESTIEELERVIRSQFGPNGVTAQQQHGFDASDLDEIPDLSLD
jgi:hypothetical protein